MDGRPTSHPFRTPSIPSRVAHGGAYEHAGVWQATAIYCSGSCGWCGLREHAITRIPGRGFIERLRRRPRTVRMQGPPSTLWSDQIRGSGTFLDLKVR
jgi:hypothetical protein